MIDFEKFAKYSKSAPRYTSYPTAIEFKESFKYENLKDALKRNDEFSLDSSLPLSIYVHLPFCKSACYFCGCNVVYTSKEDKKDRYIDYLNKEINILKKLMDTNRSVVQFHFGGGTPTFFNAEQLSKVINLVKNAFPNFSNDAEISCEIDPRHFNEEQMKALKNGGFNRLSFGVQDFEPIVQEAIHRFQSVELVKNAVDLARKYGINSINFDLIYGLPNQNLDSFLNTLKKVISLSPDRLAIFNYAHVPWVKKTMRNIDETKLPSPKIKLEILKNTIDFLGEHGYGMIGMDHFAKKTDSLYIEAQNGNLRRNFQGYTTKGFSQTIGIGLTSISEGKDYYAQNFKDMKKYEEALDSGIIPIERGVRLNEDDILRKEVIMGLMNNLKLDAEYINKKFGIDFFSHFKDEINELREYEKIGVLNINENGLYTTPTGGMLIRNIAMVFDIYYKQIKESSNTFSKTI